MAVVIIVASLVTTGIIWLILFCPECFESEEVPDPKEDHLRLIIDFDDDNEYVAGDRVDILFDKKDEEFTLYDRFGTHKGEYEYTEDEDGDEYELILDFDNDPVWDIEFNDDEFKGEKDDEDNGGKYEWLEEIRVPTYHLNFTMEFDENPRGYNKGDIVDITYQVGSRFYLRDKYGDFKGWHEYTEDKFLILDFDAYPTWYVQFLNETYFTGIEISYRNAGTYEWA